MKFLITGCAGFIGFSLARELLKNKDNNIVGVDAISDYYPISLKKKRLSILKKKNNFKFFKKDLSKMNNVKSIFTKCKFDTIIHLAAQPGVRRSIKFPQEYYDANISSFFNILECARKIKLNKIIFASSSSVYGDNKSFPLTESFERNPKNFYALSKCINEDMAKYYSRNFKMKIIGLRFFTVYGPFGRPDMLIWKICENIQNNKILKINNFGKHERDFTYIDDVVSMVKKILIKKNLNKFEIFNICSNNPTKLSKILKIFAKERKDKKNKFVRYQKFQTGDVIKTHGSNLKILKMIKEYKKTNIEEGIFKTFKWFKKNY